MLLRAFDRHGFGAWSMLALSFPPKVILAAIYRDVSAGYLDYGVAAHLCWLTKRGKAELFKQTVTPGS
jgi:hypothetical protein